MRGVILEEDPETGELRAVADSNIAAVEDNEEKFDKYGRLKNTNYVEGQDESLFDKYGRLKNPNYVEGESEKQQSVSKSKEYILHSENEHSPSKKVSLELGEEQYVDDNLQKIKELRKRLKDEHRDYLEDKQNFIANGLEEIGLSKEDMGKTGNSQTGKISEKQKTIAKSQMEDAKDAMLKRKMRESRMNIRELERG